MSASQEYGFPSKSSITAYDAEEEREMDPQGPSLSNLCAAAAYMGQLLRSKNLTYALMGGLAMVCHGSSRTTADVDIATTASMRQLWDLVEPQPGKVLPRLIVPSSRLLDKVLRVFVRTGPSYGDFFCEEDRLIEVDIAVLKSGQGSSDLSQHIDLFEFELDDHVFHFAILDLYFMMRTKLRAISSRAAGRDFDDLDFLLTHYGHEIEEISDRLSIQDRVSFLDTEEVQSKSTFVVEQYERLLNL